MAVPSSFRSGFLPATVSRIEMATGIRERILELMPADHADVVYIGTISLTPDSRFLRLLLYVEALRPLHFQRVGVTLAVSAKLGLQNSVPRILRP